MAQSWSLGLLFSKSPYPFIFSAGTTQDRRTEKKHRKYSKWYKCYPAFRDCWASIACLPSLTTALQAFKDGCVAGRDWAVHPDFQTPSAWVPGSKRCSASSDLDQARGSWGDLQGWAIGILGSVKLHSHSLVSAWMCDILRKNTGSEKRAQQSSYTQRTRQIPLGCFQVTCQV